MQAVQLPPSLSASLLLTCRCSRLLGDCTCQHPQTKALLAHNGNRGSAGQRHSALGAAFVVLSLGAALQSPPLPAFSPTLSARTVDSQIIPVQKPDGYFRYVPMCVTHISPGTFLWLSSPRKAAHGSVLLHSVFLAVWHDIFSLRVNARFRTAGGCGDRCWTRLAQYRSVSLAMPCSHAAC